MAGEVELKEGYQRVEFQNTLWEVPCRYQDLRAIGIGAFGSVCSALDTEIGIRVAIKKLSRPFQTAVHAKRAYREIKLLNHMNHENVIKLLNVFTPTLHFKDFRDVYLVTELMGSDLHKIVRTQSLSDEHVQFFIYQILRGLKYVHSAGIIHRDIKPSNIGVSEDCEIKILDFGLGRQIGEQMTGYVMTRYWRAPEIMLNWMRYGQKADVWSVGCVMAELLTGQILFPGNDYRDHLEKILQICGRPDDELLQKIESESARKYILDLPPYPQKDFNQFFVGANPMAINLLTLLLQIDPERRPNAVEALEHPYFAKYHFPKDEPVCDHMYDASFEELTKEINEWKELTFKAIGDFVCPPMPRPTTHPTLASYDTSQLSQTDSQTSTESPTSNNNPISPMSAD